MITYYIAGILTGLAPAAVACVWLDRRDAARDRIRRRVDQIPVPLPGAYEPWAERTLPGRRTHTVIDEDVS